MRLRKKLYLCSRFRGVAQLVAFLVWDQAVAGSSPVTSTLMKVFAKISLLCFFFLLLGLRAQAKDEERTFKIINAASGLADNSAQVIKCTKTGRMIISTIGNLNFYDGKSFGHADSHPKYEYSLPLYNGHYHLYFDRHHHIWLKDKHLVTCLDLMTENFVENVDSVIRSMGCQEKVLDLFADQYNDVWFLTEKGLFNPDTKRTFKVQSGHNLQDVDCMDGVLYTFYENGEVIGLDTLGNTVCQLKAYDAATSQKYADTSVLQPYGNGFFQIRNGSKGSILQFFDVHEKTWEVILSPEYHLNNMTLDTRGEHLYIPCEYGYWIYQIATKELEHVPELLLTSGHPMLTDCNAMTFDHQGGLWIGTEKRGVLYGRPHSVSFRSYPWGHELATKYAEMMDTIQQNITEYKGKKAYCKFDDSRGWSWIGTRKGLYILRPGQEEVVYTKRMGLNNDVVHSVIEDNDHNIWAATSCGITFFYIKDGEVAFVNNFTSDDNVPNESFENCKAILLPDGSIAMVAIDHVVVFNPANLHEVNFPHLITNIKPKLIRLLMNGNDVDPGAYYDDNQIVDRAMPRAKHINLKSDQNSISLTFSALNYFRPMQTFYRVRVYELGNEWIVLSCQNSTLVDNRGLLHFPMANLAPGDYHVEVQSSMFPDTWEEDVPDDKRFVWEVHVKQPWWRTSGLIMLMGLILFALLIVNFYLYNRNTRMRDRRNTEEADIIRKIRFFVERCNAISREPLSPLKVLDNDMGDDASNLLPPEFTTLMIKLMPYVSSHQNRALTMRKLSEVGGVDIVQLYETVAGNLYKSPWKLAHLLQLRKGAEMLTTTDLTIEQIATECGFYTPNYFIGSFFHEYKQTPLEYRENAKKE